MAVKSDDPPDSGELEILRSDLKALYRDPVSVPPPVDSAMRVAIRGHFKSQTRRILRARYLVPLAAAASVLIASAVALQFHSKVEKSSVAYQAVRKEDVDRNGRVDILDAFALARELRSLKGYDPARDLNGDGVVDGKDVDAVAYLAVSIEREA